MANNTNSSKDNIVDIAMALYKEKGFDNVNIVDICKKAKIARNTFYYYFQKKDDIIEEYFKKSISSKEELFSNIITLDNDWDRYLELFNINMQFLMDEGVDFTRQILLASINDKNNVFSKHFLAETWCIPILANCQKAGLVRDDIPAETLDFYATRLALGLLTTWCGADGDFDLKKELIEAVKALLLPNYKVAE